MAPTAATNPSVGDSIVTSRLLIVQSKRLMLASLDRRFRLHGEDSVGKRRERVRDEAAQANLTYRSAVLTWGLSTSHEFRLIAYSSLTNLAEALVLELRETITGRTPRVQLELATEVEVLEDLIDQWRRKARPVAAVA
jgi:hypothetical protein